MVYRELTFTYAGKKYTFTPSMALVGRIRQIAMDSRTSFVRLAQSVAGMDPDNYSFALIMSEFSAASGSRIPEDECFAFLQSGGDGVQTFYTAFLNTVFPEVDLGKKPAAPEEQEAKE